MHAASPPRAGTQAGVAELILSNVYGPSSEDRTISVLWYASWRSSMKWETRIDDTLHNEVLNMRNHTETDWERKRRTAKRMLKRHLRSRYATVDYQVKCLKKESCVLTPDCLRIIRKIMFNTRIPLSYNVISEPPRDRQLKLTCSKSFLFMICQLETR